MLYSYNAIITPYDFDVIEQRKQQRIYVGGNRTKITIKDLRQRKQNKENNRGFTSEETEQR